MRIWDKGGCLLYPGIVIIIYFLVVFLISGIMLAVDWIKGSGASVLG